MAETIKLDPSTIATSRTELDITPFISAEGVNWDDARIEQYLSDGNIGASPVDYKIPNRQVVAPLRLMARGTFTFEQIRRQLQAKVALFQREGGWVSRVTTAGTHYADVVNASLRLGGDWLQASKSADVAAELSLELTPDWYGSEITLDDKTETAALALTTVLKQSAADAVIAGDYPARVRIVVDEDDGDTQLGLVWGFRSRYYDAASTAALTYQAEALTPLDTAANAALTGASGGTAVTHSAVRTDWTAVVSTQILSGSAHMTHRGTYRVWARCYSTSAVPPAVRFVWKVGDLVNPVENTRKTIPAASNFYMLDLGEIRIDAAPVGTHRWQGRVEAIGTTSAENVSVDAIHFVPVDDGYGILRAPTTATVGSYVAHDDFNQSAGALAGKTASLGGVWAGAGDADDFAVETTGKTAQRTAVSDASVATGGRHAYVGTTTFTTCTVQVDFKRSLALGGVQCWQGVLARATDASNFVVARIAGVSAMSVRLEAYVAGSLSFVSTEMPVSTFSANTWYTIRLYVEASGRYGFWFGPKGALPVAPAVTGQSAVLATGGALATGKVGIFDSQISATAHTRNYDSFRAYVPTFDAVLYPNRSAQLRSDGAIRQDTGGTSYASVDTAYGAIPRLPPSGLENRKVELYVKASRGNFDQDPDFGIDDVSAQVFYRPAWLLTPGS